MKRRIFTPAEANRTLPLVQRIVADILAKGRSYRELAAERDEEDTQAERGAEDLGIERRLDELEVGLREHFAELTAIGCDYKDWSFDKGLVDFPGELDGRRVLWCWRSDEDSVTWYHDLESGFAGRMPIPTELLAESGAPAGR